VAVEAEDQSSEAAEAETGADQHDWSYDDFGSYKDDYGYDEDYGYEEEYDEYGYEEEYDSDDYGYDESYDDEDYGYGESYDDEEYGSDDYSYDDYSYGEYDSEGYGCGDEYEYAAPADQYGEQSDAGDATGWESDETADDYDYDYYDYDYDYDYYDYDYDYYDGQEADSYDYDYHYDYDYDADYDRSAYDPSEEYGSYGEEVDEEVYENEGWEDYDYEASDEYGCEAYDSQDSDAYQPDESGYETYDEYDADEYDADEYDADEYDADEYDADEYDAEAYDYEPYDDGEYDEYDSEAYGYDEYDAYDAEDYGYDYEDSEEYDYQGYHYEASDESTYDGFEYQGPDTYEAYDVYDYESEGYDYESDGYDYQDYEYDDEPCDYNRSDGFGDDSWQSADAETVDSSAMMVRGTWIDLYDWLPGDLLTAEDQDLLADLQQMFEEPAQLRREAWNDYVLELGSEAIELVLRLEETTSWQVLDMADDLPRAAVLLATFRLIEQGELTVEDATALLDRALGNLSEEWVEEVSVISLESPQWIGTGADQGDAWSDQTETAPRNARGATQFLLSWAGRCVPDEWSDAFRRILRQSAAIQARLPGLPADQLQAVLSASPVGSDEAL